jgi:hypothetical protein
MQNQIPGFDPRKLKSDLSRAYWRYDAAVRQSIQREL